MTATLLVQRAGPVATIQDAGRFGLLRYGISASGPMDRAGFAAAAAMLEVSGSAGVEFTQAGICLEVMQGTLQAGLAGGEFRLSVNGQPRPWPARVALAAGDVVDVTPGASGSYGYLRADGELLVEPVLGSRATNVVARLGGLEGRALRRGDRLEVGEPAASPASDGPPVATAAGAIRFIWGLHAHLFADAVRHRFTTTPFAVSPRLDRMGIRLIDQGSVFKEAIILSLVSDPVVPGDIQILGDGTPIVLMRDHQPTGGYPRIGTVIDIDLDRLAQMRPGESLSFAPITVQHAHALSREARR